MWGWVRIFFFFFCVQCDDRAKSSGWWLLGSPPSAVVRQLALRAWCLLQCLLAKTVGVLSPGVGRSEERAQGFAPQSHIHSGLNQQDLVSSDVFVAHSDQYADERWWFGSSCQGCLSGWVRMKKEKHGLPKTVYKLRLLQRKPQKKTSFHKQNGNKTYRPKLQQLLKAFILTSLTLFLNTHTRGRLICTHVCVRTHTLVCARTHTHTHTCTQTRAHMHSHTHTHTPLTSTILYRFH